MGLSTPAIYTAAIAITDFIGSLLIIGYIVAALVVLLRRRGLLPARLLVAEGALWGLNFKVAATLLKTIVIHTWQELAFFTIIFALRTLIKWVFTWEQKRLLAQQTPAMPAVGD